MPKQILSQLHHSLGRCGKSFDKILKNSKQEKRKVTLGSQWNKMEKNLRYARKINRFWGIKLSFWNLGQLQKFRLIHVVAIPLEKAMASHSSTLAWKIHGQRSLVGCSPWSHEELDTTEWLHFHFSLSCIGEGNGNPLQCSCLENPRDGRAWWAAVYGVTQSRTRLKRLSSSSSSSSNSFRKDFIKWRILFMGLLEFTKRLVLLISEMLNKFQYFTTLLSWLYLREFQTTHCPANKWCSSGSSVPCGCCLLLPESFFLPHSSKLKSLGRHPRLQSAKHVAPTVILQSWLKALLYFVCNNMYSIWWIVLIIQIQILRKYIWFPIVIIDILY